MKKTIYVILAPSRSGKDSLASAIGDELLAQGIKRYTPFKWAGYVKRVVEQTYGLPEFALEDDNFRNQIIPGTFKTYLDLLKDFYHCQAHQADPFFWKRPQLRLLEELMADGTNICSTDTRDIFEAANIIELACKYSYTITVIKLKREGTEGLSTDHLCDRIFQMFKEVPGTTIYNKQVPDSPYYMNVLSLFAREIVLTA